MLTLRIGVMIKSPAFKGTVLFIKNGKIYIIDSYRFAYYVQKFFFIHFFRVRQFLGICCVAKASKQGLLKKSLVH